MSDLDPHAYGPIFSPLLIVDRRRSLDKGATHRSATSALADLTHERAFNHTRVNDREMASCCIAGVWLLHDYLDESHATSQSIETPSGSYWHAIMHRREGDFSNAKYWLRRVGKHPVIGQISDRLADTYDPFRFVEMCETAVRGQHGDRDKCLEIQQIEWELLFDYCYSAAIDALESYAR